MIASLIGILAGFILIMLGLILGIHSEHTVVGVLIMFAGLVIYNPKNLAERIKGMKNKNVSREDKIKARLLYENNNAESVN